MKLHHHAKLTESKSVYNVINSQGNYIQEIVSADELQPFMEVLNAKMTTEKPTGVKYPRSEFNQFYKNI